MRPCGESVMWIRLCGRILHASGFTTAERQSYAYLVHCNTLQSVVDVLTAMKQHDIPLVESQSQVVHAPAVSIATSLVRRRSVSLIQVDMRNLNNIDVYIVSESVEQ